MSNFGGIMGKYFFLINYVIITKEKQKKIIKIKQKKNKRKTGNLDV
jgi:hypothetical protein